MNTQETIDYAEKVAKLGELCDLQYDELSELWEVLVNIWDYQDYFLSPGFLQSVMAEIDAQWDNIQQNATLCEEQEDTTVRTVFLKWK